MEKIDHTTIVCNHADFSGKGKHIRLNLWGRDEMKIYPRIEVISNFLGDVGSRLTDFIEIATYIYAADQAIVRCQGFVDEHGLRWNRNITMLIAVQDYDFWSREDVIGALQEILNFLSDDRVDFKFVKMKNRPPEQSYFRFIGNETCLTEKPEQVMLFSGGLDSLGGAVKEMIVDGRQTVLVRHRSSDKFKTRYTALEKALQARSNGKGCFISINTGKDQDITKEYTQRGRSFLYFALAATIANLLGLKNIRFYENGPVSFNLPLSGQVVGGRATRTTHPQTLYLFQKLMSLITEDEFKVENPFLNMTKSDVIKLLLEQNCGDLILQSMSCAHSWQQSNLHRHCGVCSQCIDRRVAIIAADAQNYDDPQDYLIDFFTESVDTPKDDFEAENKNLLTSYFLRGDKISDDTYTMRKFESDYPALYDAILYMDGDPFNATKKIYSLYRRFAKDIQKVAEYATSGDFLEKARRVKGGLVPDCLCNILLQNTRPSIEYRKIEPAPLYPYIFKRSGEVWMIRFAGGKIKLFTDMEGMFVLRKLLANPDVDFSMEQLSPENTDVPMITVDMDEIVDGYGSGESYEPASDTRALEEYKNEIGKLEKELDDAKQENNNILQEQIQAEIEKIRSHIRKSIMPNGRIKNLNKGPKRKKDRIERNIRTIKSKLEKHCPEFKKHLDNFLTLGKNPCYKPDVKIEWDVSEE